MASTLVKVFVAIASIVLSVVVTLFFNSIIPTERNYLIGMGVLLFFCFYIAFYSLTKGAG